MVYRVLVEKKPGFDVEAKGVFHDLSHNLGIRGLTGVRIIQQYDVEGIDASELDKITQTIFSEAPVDFVGDEIPSVAAGDRMFALEYLPGQYDQRADSAAQAIQLVTHKAAPLVHTARRYVLEGGVSDADFEAVRKYVVNPVESRLADTELPVSLVQDYPEPPMVEYFDGFIDAADSDIASMAKDLGLAMSAEDLLFCREYFKNTEDRNPSVTEIRMIDTYWSDHCRHTTFLTGIDSVSFDDGPYKEAVESVFSRYLAVRKDLYGDKERPVTLMDLAVIAAKALKKTGALNDLDESEEINACSIRIEAEIDGKKEPWLLMFKNETHNHPTEIEPFGGAATCLGGAIRDPLSGRSYVYQAMRVTGAGDPRTPVSGTIPGKLPQRKICSVAAHGYSSYGNQIGLATGQVAELYHPGYVAKRMEIGAVVGAAPAENVRRERPAPGDLIVLLGGRTGRDGIGGATGSSKAHTEESLESCGAEVQKGNPPTERKIQRLFRNKQATTLIKRCNDFGAGGVSVAIGELADGLRIDLDKVPKKYAGLDGTELAISESQERMAVVVAKADADTFRKLAADENLESVIVAEVTAEPRLVMTWRGETIVDLARSFLDTNGVTQHTSAEIVLSGPDPADAADEDAGNEAETLEAALSSLDAGSRKGLVERFDSTIGAATVLMPFGGTYQRTPAEGMISLLPVEKGVTTTTSVMTWGFDPYLSESNPFLGASYAVIASLAKILALGGDYKKARLTFQEYFERMSDKEKWGKPLVALLGAFQAQMEFQTPSIGGKDSMSGSFMDLHVPPTLVSFAVCASSADKAKSAELKGTDTAVLVLPLPASQKLLPEYDGIKALFDTVAGGIENGEILSVGVAGRMCSNTAEVRAKISEMAFGNMIGLDFSNAEALPMPLMPGSLIIEVPTAVAGKYAGGVVAATTCDTSFVRFSGSQASLGSLYETWSGVLDDVYPQIAPASGRETAASLDIASVSMPARSPGKNINGAPLVTIPVFPGTNCEYDSARAFEQAGARVNTIVIKNLDPADIESSIKAVSDSIAKSQIVMIPGGFSAGDEPEGSGKFIASFFRNPRVADAVADLMDNRDGLMLGICNGFQALIKLGLLPYGRICDLSPDSPSLTFNTIGRHVSSLVHTRVANNSSPWLAGCGIGEVHTVPVSHGEGRFVADGAHMNDLISRGQVAFQYTDPDGAPRMDMPWNPNGSVMAVEGITSPDGRILGKMGHSERRGKYLYANVPGEKEQRIFEAGVGYFA